MFDGFAYPCTVVGVIVSVRDGTLMDMFVGVEMVITEVRTNVVDGVCADIRVEVGVSEVEIIVTAALEFVVPKSCAEDVLTGMLVGVVGDTLSGVLAGITSCVVSGIGVDVSTEININVLTAVTTVEIAVPTPL